MASWHAAIQEVRQATGVDVIIDRAALGNDAYRQSPQVENLFIDQPAPASQVLAWILRNAGRRHARLRDRPRRRPRLHPRPASTSSP